MVNDGDDDEEVQFIRKGGDPLFDRIPTLKKPTEGDEVVYNPEEPDSEDESSEDEDNNLDTDETPHVRTRAMRRVDPGLEK
jgi:hypothetical protein